MTRQTKLSMVTLLAVLALLVVAGISPAAPINAVAVTVTPDVQCAGGRMARGSCPDGQSLTTVVNTTVTLTADSTVTPTATELVTFALPLREGSVTNLSQLKIEIGGSEVAAYVEAGLTHHWSDNSIRSATIQLQNVDMTSGDVVVTVTNSGASIARLTEQPHSNGWTNAGANKSNLPFPRIFALHDPQYLADSGLNPPHATMVGQTDTTKTFQDTQFDTWAGALNFSTSSRGNWLFDRATAMFKVYMSTGDVKYLKEAFLSKQFYFTHIKNDGTPQSPADGDGCFTYETTYCSDVKYIYSEPAKLGLALVGDTSQWDNELINEMATRGDMGWWQPPTRGALPTDENFNFTERAAGMAGLLEINAWEITGNATTLANLNDRIDYLKGVQQTEFTWDTTNSWTPKSGAFTHNYLVHEGAESVSSAAENDTNSRAFSPWMSENIADFLWHTYWITSRSDIPQILINLADAIDRYGFTSQYNSGSYTLRPAFAGQSPHAYSCNPNRANADTLYFGSAYADNAALSQDNWWPWYSDQHNIEMILMLAAGAHFESDPDTKARFLSRANQMRTWANPSCAVVTTTRRLWNWQHRSNSLRTLEWVEAN